MKIVSWYDSRPRVVAMYELTHGIQQREAASMRRGVDAPCGRPAGSLLQRALACDPLPNWTVPRVRYASTTLEAPKARPRWPCVPWARWSHAPNLLSSGYLTLTKAANLAGPAIGYQLFVRNYDVRSVSVYDASRGCPYPMSSHLFFVAPIVLYICIIHVCSFQCSNAAFVFYRDTQATWILLKRPSWLRKRKLPPRIVSARCAAHHLVGQQYHKFSTPLTRF